MAVHIFNAIGTTTIIWHDLTEDPNDLPKDVNEQYYILIRNAVTGEFINKYFVYDLEYWSAHYDPEYGLWLFTCSDKYGDMEPNALTSYGTKQCKELATYVKFDPNIEVIAWAEQRYQGEAIPNYIPAIYKEETK